MTILGETLRAARQAKGTTLGQAEAATRIRSRHLQALEGEAWASLPDSLYVKGFLRSYARYLGLDAAMSANFDQAYVDVQANSLGTDVAEFWQAVKTASQQEAAQVG